MALRTAAAALLLAVLAAGCAGPAPALVDQRELRELHDLAEAALLATTTAVTDALRDAGTTWEAAVQDAVPLTLCPDADGAPVGDAYAYAGGDVALVVTGAVPPATVEGAVRAAAQGWVDGSDLQLADLPVPADATVVLTSPDGAVTLLADERPLGDDTLVGIAVVTPCTAYDGPTLVDEVTPLWGDEVTALRDAAAP